MPVARTQGFLLSAARFRIRKIDRYVGSLDDAAVSLQNVPSRMSKQMR